MRRFVRRLIRPFTIRLDRVEARVDEVDHRIGLILQALEWNRQEILAARHEAHSLLVQDLDAGTEATTLLSRGLQDTRTAIDDAADDLRIEIDKLRDSFDQRDTEAEPPSPGGGP